MKVKGPHFDLDRDNISPSNSNDVRLFLHIRVARARKTLMERLSSHTIALGPCEHRPAEFMRHLSYLGYITRNMYQLGLRRSMSWKFSDLSATDKMKSREWLVEN